MNQASVLEWHKRFKEGRESVRDDQRCGRSKEVNTPELSGQRLRLGLLVFLSFFMHIMYISVSIHLFLVCRSVNYATHANKHTHIYTHILYI